MNLNLEWQRPKPRWSPPQSQVPSVRVYEKPSGRDLVFCVNSAFVHHCLDEVLFPEGAAPAASLRVVFAVDLESQTLALRAGVEGWRIIGEFPRNRAGVYSSGQWRTVVDDIEKLSWLLSSFSEFAPAHSVSRQEDGSVIFLFGPAEEGKTV